MSLLGWQIGKTKFKLYTPFTLKPAILGPVFDEILSTENGFNIGHAHL